MTKAGIDRVLPWKYSDGRVVEVLPEYIAGNYLASFLYKLEFKDGDYYIGKHTVYHKQCQKRLESGIERPNHVCWTMDRTKERFYKEDWKTYYGSGKGYELNDISNRIILAWCENRYVATFYEAKLIFEHFFDKKCLNGNVLGGFYKDSRKLTEDMIHWC